MGRRTDGRSTVGEELEETRGAASGLNKDRKLLGLPPVAAAGSLLVLY